MKVTERMDMCFRNLTRRKTRTLLTVIGVVVGTCAIVVMVSLGIGMKISQEAALSSMGDLKMIQVYNYQNGKGDSQQLLDDTKISEWGTLDGVDFITPMYTANIPSSIIAGKNNRYRGYMDVVGVYPEALEKFGYELIEGEFLPEEVSGKNIPVVVGEKTAYNFQDTKRPEMNNYVYPEPDAQGVIAEPFFDITKEKMVLQSDSADGKSKPYQRSLQVVGKLKEDYSKDYRTSSGCFMKIEDLKRITTEIQKYNHQKVEASTGYSEVCIRVKNIKYIESIEEVIKADGYETSSMETIRKPMEEQARQQQSILGGLGAISLLVAAIGITNTMVMSIHERTKEIGIMKALGCYVKDIRKIFLLEAASIGLMGGVMGIIISYIISFLMNTFRIGQMNSSDLMYMEGSPVSSAISVIPIWLALLALVFSTLIGLIAGYYPAGKAVKISALEAIKSNE